MPRMLKAVALLGCGASLALVMMLYRDPGNVFQVFRWDHPARAEIQLGAAFIELAKSSKDSPIAFQSHGEDSSATSKAYLKSEAQTAVAASARKENGGPSMTILPKSASIPVAAADVNRSLDAQKSTEPFTGDSTTVAASAFSTTMSAQSSTKAQPTMDLISFSDKLFLVRAYADHRTNPPAVKIIVYAFKSVGADLYCSIGGRLYEARLTWINFPSEELAIWRAGYLECEVEGLTTEDGSSFEVTDGGGKTRVRMPLGQPLSTQPRPTFGLCVKSAYGAPSALRFVEWMELNALLGVERVILYAQDLRGPIVKAMQYYADSGRLVVVKDNFRRLIEQTQPRFVDLFAGFDATHASGDEPYAQLELLSIQDCFHRFRGAFEYIIVADIDEVIVPANGSTMQDLLRVLRRRAPRATSFAHQTAAYLPNFGMNPAMNASAYTYMIAHTRRTEISWDGSKAFHSTADTDSVNWHRRISPRDNIAYVDPREAWLHHYRGSCKGFSCDSNVKVVDDGAAKLGNLAAALASRVAAVTEKLRNG